MPLYPVKEFSATSQTPIYSRVHPRDLTTFDVYSGYDKIGTVMDLLVEDGGQIRYLVIRIGSWIFSRKVLLPIGRSRINERLGRIQIDGLTRSQLKQVPEYRGLPIDAIYEEQIRESYRSRKIHGRATAYGHRRGTVNNRAGQFSDTASTAVMTVPHHLSVDRSRHSSSSLPDQTMAGSRTVETNQRQIDRRPRIQQVDPAVTVIDRRQ